MSKKLFIAEKPSVAQEFAKALKQNFSRKDGYQESNESVVTWCVGHLVTMSYPEAYDPALKKWAVETLPFLPKEYKYELIPAVEKQFKIVKGLLNREDMDCIYICTDSGREGEYIYRLVDQMAKVPANKERRRVWIDSQTEEEILRGIREAKLWTEYDNLSDSAYLRAKEDYLMGINFSRILTLKYGYSVRNFMKSDKNIPISVGRVMTCVLGMVVRREREIRAFVKTPFYRVLASVLAGDSDKTFDAEFRAVEGSKYFNTPMMYKENGFKKEEDAKALIDSLQGQPARVHKVERKKENKNAPLLFNLAELQNECSKLFKISPDETLKITQELYEKKLVTYPRTDARVLSTAVAKEIYKNIAGLKNFGPVGAFASEIMENKSYQGLAKTRYVNDKQITDHYAIIPTGQGLSALNSVSAVAGKVYQLICRRFLSIFYPPAVYQKLAIELLIGEEHFFANFKVLLDEGYYKVAGNPGKKRQETKETGGTPNASEEGEDGDKESKKAKDSGEEELEFGEDMLALFQNLKSGMELPVKEFNIKEGETSPPKRYNSGSLILAMENAGQLIEDEELRAQIKGSGIGTSATRAEILNKLIKITYLNLNKKTQIITPTLLGEVIYDVVACSIKSLLNAELTASWEKGLTYVAEGSITSEEYMQKLEGFVSRMTNGVKGLNNQNSIVGLFIESAKNYK
ncbi:MAG: type IA DNA topoisomerase [Lachnospiraceae bacterium]|nr:type IA DNA topoisomerase [Lachnospiraceae bacterium]